MKKLLFSVGLAAAVFMSASANGELHLQSARRFIEGSVTRDGRIEDSFLSTSIIPIGNHTLNDVAAIPGMEAEATIYTEFTSSRIVFDSLVQGFVAFPNSLAYAHATINIVFSVSEDTLTNIFMSASYESGSYGSLELLRQNGTTVPSGMTLLEPGTYTIRSDLAVQSVTPFSGRFGNHEFSLIVLPEPPLVAVLAGGSLIGRSRRRLSSG